MVKQMQMGERGQGLKFDVKTILAVRKFTPWTRIKYMPNRKTPGSKSYDRYNKYMGARTVGESIHRGSKVVDLLWEYNRGHYKVLGEPKAKGKLRGMTPKDVEKVQEKLAGLGCVRGLSLRIDDPRAEKELAREEAWLRLKMQRAADWAKKLGVRLEAETRTDLEEDGVHETSDIRNGRLVANALATERLKAAARSRSKITVQDVTEVLGLWGFAQNSGRVNVLPDGRKWVYSDTLGGILRRTGGYGITPPTKRYPAVAKLLNQWLYDNRPEGLPCDFACTSININANYGARVHRDGNNEGPSAIRAFGDFKGGELFYWNNDDKKTPLENLKRKDARKLNIKRATAIFDGNRAHEVADFTGERVSVVWFCCRKCHKVGKKNIEFLKKKAGFRWPTGKTMSQLKKAAERLSK